MNKYFISLLMPINSNIIVHSKI